MLEVQRAGSNYLNRDIKQGLIALGFTSMKSSNPKKTARCWCKRAVESGVRVRYCLRPLADSRRISEVLFIDSMYHNSFIYLCKPRSSGSSVDVETKLVC